MFKEKVHNNIKKHNLIKSGEIVIVGLSGGPDSLALIHVLSLLKEELKFSLHAVHVNHLLRGVESDGDEVFVKDFCNERGISLSVIKVDINLEAKRRGKSLEETAREERYKIFNNIANEKGGKKIAVAHNNNDQAETVIMNIIRGSGLEGICGMKFLREKIIRPMLNISRDEVEEYLKDQNLEPRIDSSNLETCYTRNKLRLKLIPFINDSFGINVTNSVVRLSNIIKDDNDFLEEVCQETFLKVVEKSEDCQIIIDLKKFSKLHKALKNRIIRYIVKNLKGNLIGIENINIEQVVDLALNGNTSSAINLPFGIIVSKSYNQLRFRKDYKKGVDKITDKVVNIPDEILLESGGKLITSVEDLDGLDKNLIKRVSKSYEQYFDYDKIEGQLVLRARTEGDRINLYKGKSSKKLKEYFIDNKVDREIRDSIPLIAYKNEILWIIEYAVSNIYNITEDTKRVLKMKFIKK